MGTWHYQVYEAVDNAAELSKFLDEQDAEGWELVAITSAFVPKSLSDRGGLVTTVVLRRPR